ncbi:hypothetical protein QUA56_32750 [Microcoleus sp. N3A4]|uniref:hypothetical protein n=1 Tax=Microcoleus sp. N3A4 TaxID=3055379 RepID=UPI002FD4CCDF
MTAWASKQRLVLGQVKVEDHSNEITAIPALLELIDISGAIITIDAMGTLSRNSPTDSSEKSRLCRGTKKQSFHSLQ